MTAKILSFEIFQFVPRLYGFKIHPHAYVIQQQAAANFKVSGLETGSS